MEFTKMHGLGNDFIVVQAVSFEDAIRFKPHSQAWCDRHFGIGADGILVTGPDQKEDIFMRIFNPDGSEAEMCGNGIRCIAVYAKQTGMIEKDEFSVKTLAGPRHIKMAVAELDGNAVRVDMGQPVMHRPDIPVQGEGSNIDIPVNASGQWFDVTAVSMGNPHAIILVEDAALVPLEQWGPKLEKHPIFPAATNVEFVQVIGDQEIIVRVWERGAGVTLACGTGACASVVACNLKAKTKREVRVHLPGGDLLIEWNREDDHVYMTGPARVVFRGRISDHDVSLPSSMTGKNNGF